MSNRCRKCALLRCGSGLAATPLHSDGGLRSARWDCVFRYRAAFNFAAGNVVGRARVQGLGVMGAARVGGCRYCWLLIGLCCQAVDVGGTIVAAAEAIVVVATAEGTIVAARATAIVVVVEGTIVVARTTAVVAADEGATVAGVRATAVEYFAATVVVVVDAEIVAARATAL
ncbi:hypothetical protein CYMTET_40564 [Cymbomonas tetramitiformis]|uniref:Uncharacterized protein n=1 Tax=Cymbomonas tetramitiformis TaxID=36881 RepID=A0AAE0C7W3_9CHLO|nr:hypothetical protein CYMTET_40564 [Cymbomonas tetramitiformis]